MLIRNKNSITMLLLICMTFTSFDYNVFATEGTPSTDHYAKTAYIKNVKKDGTNLNNDIIDKNKYILDDTKLSVTQTNNAIQISGVVKNRRFNINAVATGTNENGNIVYFTGESTNKDLEVVHISVEKNIVDSNMYFKQYLSENLQYTTMLKVYLKETEAKKRNYIILETYGFQMQNTETVLTGLTETSELGSWGSREFEPLSEKNINESENSDISIMALVNSRSITISKTFVEMGATQTHKIRFLLYSDYCNIPRSLEGNQVYNIKITSKSISSTVPSDNSSTQSALIIDDVSLRLATIPNTAFRGSSIYGTVKKDNIFSGSLDASIGFNVGLLGASVSIPSVFSNSGSVNLNTPYTGYINGINGKYTRAIKVKMGAFRLVDIGNNFGTVATIRDYGNVATNYSILNATWDISIKNNANLVTYAYTYNQNNSIKVN
ncbi:MAG: hypothetical protein CVU98_11705 [Firmicutes bacterium HGW-Firmicutes-3]|nr:MAG: hypothetical protein CVU98_11705 [Firmicutes bacterium HGW-Firmicutes-3]